jgi:hypothetical protein
MIPQRSETLERVLDHIADMRNGKFDLRWMQANPDGWGTRAKPSALGLTIADINVGKYGVIPEQGSPFGSMAPRGCEIPDDMPSLGTYDVDDRGTVWSDNCAELYEEAVARQWSSARDIPWDRLQELPDDIERAVCQLCTQLTEVEFIAGDLPAKWLWRINHDFHEVKLFLASQVFDEARHLDVFRKRALANGGGLLAASPGAEHVLRVILEAPNYTVASSLMHILAEGFVLTLFRSGEFLAPTEVEKKIFRLCMQDEARHVGYGTLHLKRFLQEHPERAEEVHQILDVGEEAMLGLFMEPTGIEPRLILAGGGVDRMLEGMMRTAFLFQKQVREYLHRLQVAGLDRSRRCKMPLELPQ